VPHEKTRAHRRFESLHEKRRGKKSRSENKKLEELHPNAHPPSRQSPRGESKKVKIEPSHGHNDKSDGE